MSSIPTPQLPLYRITLFYGPETVADLPSCVACVFNVKKRSWKGGVQIAVEIDEAQLDRIRQRLGIENWVKNLLAPVHMSERDAYGQRAADLFIQEVCSLKLSFALEADIRQENGRIECRRFTEEVERAAVEHGDHIKSNIQKEFDLPA